jgi:N-acetylmuramoyl-L-alanine amidase
VESRRTARTHRARKARKARPALVAAAVVGALLVIGGAMLAVLHPWSTAAQAASGSRPRHPAQAVGARSRLPTAHADSPPATADPHRSTHAPHAPRTPPARPLAGKVIGIDPGHNGANGTDPSYIDHLIWNGRESETCDTTGTETDGGYTEARFNFNVAMYLRADLRRAGARVVLTRTSNDGVGPCVNRRARILDAAHADVAIDIHGDGGPPWGRGFAVLEPVADGPNDTVIGSSERFGADVRAAMLGDTSMPVSNYDGRNGVQPRNDLAGLNLTTVPKVLIECGNMRNAVDAQLLTSASFQRRLAAAFTASITRFLAHA